MLRIALLTSFLIAFTSVTPPIARCQSTFEIRPVVDYLRQGAVGMIDEQSHQEVFVGGKPLFSILDVDSANVSLGRESDGTPLYAVNIYFKPSLNDSMKSLTGSLIGHQLAFIVDGRVLATPKILDTVQTARVGLFATTETEARELAKKIMNTILKH